MPLLEPVISAVRPVRSNSFTGVSFSDAIIGTIEPRRRLEMRMRCLCLVIHGADDLRVMEQDAGEIGPGQVLVKVGYGGICGSDLHYFHDGGFGTVRLKEPMILGHEVAGTVAAVAPDVTSHQIGDRVAINP